jgi:hypothetical protein
MSENYDPILTFGILTSGTTSHVFKIVVETPLEGSS